RLGVAEGHDAGEGDAEVHVHRRARDLPGLAETVHHAADLARALLLQDAQGVGRRLPGVDDERLAAGARSADVAAEALVLPCGRLLGAVIVEPGLADRDDAGIGRSRDQLFHGRVAAAALVRVNPDRGVYL